MCLPVLGGGGEGGGGGGGEGGGGGGGLSAFTVIPISLKAPIKGLGL